MILNRHCRANPFVLGIYICAFVTNVCFAAKVVQSPRGIQHYHAAIYGGNGFGGQGLGGAVELQSLMPRDALPVLRLGSPATRKTSLFKRALLGHRDSDDGKECDSEDCSLTTQTCCADGCMPIGAECCSSLSSDNDDDDDDDDDDDGDGLYCEQGSRCGIFKDEVKCCRDSACSREKEAEEKEEESRATTRLSTQVSGFTATITTPTTPPVTLSTSSIIVLGPLSETISASVTSPPPTVTFTTSALLPSVTPSESITPSSSSITSPLGTSILQPTTTSLAAITTTTTVTSAGAATGPSSSSIGGGDAAAGAGAVATGLANRRVSSSWRVEGVIMLGLIGGFVYALI